MCLELVPQVVYNMEKLKVYSLDKHVKKHVKNLTTRNKLLNGVFKAESYITQKTGCEIASAAHICDLTEAYARYARSSSNNIIGADCGF